MMEHLIRLVSLPDADARLSKRRQDGESATVEELYKFEKSCTGKQSQSQMEDICMDRETSR